MAARNENGRVDSAKDSGIHTSALCLFRSSRMAISRFYSATAIMWASVTASMILRGCAASPITSTEYPSIRSS